MDWIEFTAKFKAEILMFLDGNDGRQAKFAQGCDKNPPNLNQFLSSKRGMNIKSFCIMYEKMGGELQDIFDALNKRQQEKKRK